MLNSMASLYRSEQKNAEALERYQQALALAQSLPPGALRDQALAFGTAHETMGAGYRRGLEAFRAAGGDAARAVAAGIPRRVCGGDAI